MIQTKGTEENFPAQAFIQNEEMKTTNFQFSKLLNLAVTEF